MRKAIDTGILWFVFGVCATEAVVDTFCPQYGDVLWLRVAGGLAPAVICTLGYLIVTKGRGFDAPSAGAR
jgi:hypothetical protein